MYTGDLGGGEHSPRQAVTLADETGSSEAAALGIGIFFLGSPITILRPHWTSASHPAGVILVQKRPLLRPQGPRQHILDSPWCGTTEGTGAGLSHGESYREQTWGRLLPPSDSAGLSQGTKGHG